MFYIFAGVRQGGILSPLLVGQHSKPIVHFVIQAPNLAQMYINILRTFSDIGPLGILSLCLPYWISKWPPFEIYICDYLWV